MKRFSKVSFDDIKTIQVDSGVLLKSFDVENPIVLQENVICATSGGINPVCAPEYYDFGEDVDNAKPSKETKRIRGWNATISFTTLTTSLTAIKLALGAADISGKVLSLRQRLQYAKDFSDIWWVGKRADDKLLAIRLIRSLSDSGFSLQTTKKGKGQISVTLKGHSSFSDIKKVPMEIYVLEEAPTASLYLYGTPSTTGNIGLRNGEIVTLYDGAVLPPLPEWDKTKYPYAYVCIRTALADDYYYAVFASDVLVIRTIDGKDYLTAPTGEIAVQYCSAGTDGDYWRDFDTYNIDEDYKRYHSPFWCNHDLYTADGKLYKAVSNPIPVSGLVGYSYNGEVVTAEIPEKIMSYPYVIFIRNADNWYNAYGLDTEPYTESHKYPIGDPFDRLRLDSGNECAAEYQVDEWGYVGEEQSVTEWSQGYASWNLKNIAWANFDIYASDGSLYLAKSDPVPVYE